MEYGFVEDDFSGGVGEVCVGFVVGNGFLIFGICAKIIVANNTHKIKITETKKSNKIFIIHSPNMLKLL
jgi:hypothetical protein